MVEFIIISFLASIVALILFRVIKDKKINYKLLTKDIVKIRGVYFIIYYMYIVFHFMQIDKESSYVLIPFLLCGAAALLCMYKKTRKIGSFSFLIIFFGSPLLLFFYLIKRDGLENMELSSGLFVIIWLIFGILAFRSAIKSSKDE